MVGLIWHPTEVFSKSVVLSGTGGCLAFLAVSEIAFTLYIIHSHSDKKLGRPRFIFYSFKSNVLEVLGQEIHILVYIQRSFYLFQL